MTSISSIETVTAKTQSPLRQDLTPAQNGHNPTDDYDDPPPPSQWKGKQRQPSYDASEDDDEQHGSDFVDPSAYPPTTEDAAEARRVEENLRRWEIAERKRRKAARESANGGPSLVSDVVRRASLLWTNNQSEAQPRNVPFTSHDHTKLQSRESLSLESQPNSPIGSAFPQVEAPTSSAESNENPFASPSDPQPSSQHLQVPSKKSKTSKNKQQRPQSTVKPPPPEPLNLPPPRTPPPRLSVSPPDEDRPQQQQQLDTDEQRSKPTRWWHEILCGCGESGGNQAGRTNPFE